MTETATIKSQSYLSSKPRVNTFSSENFGIKPSFYKPEDVAMFVDVMTKLGFKPGGGSEIDFNPETLHTYHPNVNIPPLTGDSKLTPSDEYGFMRLGITANFARPYLQNVRSCHRMERDLKAPGGNLSYLANAWWATYAIYKDPDSQCAFVSDCGGLTPDKIALPNLIATVNVQLGFDNKGTPSAVLSRVYGVSDFNKSGDKTAMPGSGLAVVHRLVSYLQYKLGLKVYAHPKWLGTFHDYSGNKIRVKDDAPRTVVTSPAICAQIHAAYGKERTIVFRYPDIDRPYSHYDSKVEGLWVIESHEAVEIIPNTFVGVAYKAKHLPVPIRVEFDAGKYRQLAGFRPINPLFVCASCGVDNETSSKVRIQQYETFGYMCDKCIQKYMVYSRSQDRQIPRENAVRVYVGGVDYVERDRIPGYIVKLDKPHPAYAIEWGHVDYVVGLPVAQLNSDKVVVVRNYTIASDCKEFYFTRLPAKLAKATGASYCLPTDYDAINALYTYEKETPHIAKITIDDSLPHHMVHMDFVDEGGKFAYYQFRTNVGYKQSVETEFGKGGVDILSDSMLSVIAEVLPEIHGDAYVRVSDRSILSSPNKLRKYMRGQGYTLRSNKKGKEDMEDSWVEKDAYFTPFEELRGIEYKVVDIKRGAPVKAKPKPTLIHDEDL
jgi:hypothetical protein